jgi:hypothetical protein
MRLDDSSALPIVSAPPPPPQRSQLPLLVVGVIAAATLGSTIMYLAMRTKTPAAVVARDAAPPRSAVLASDAATDAAPPIDAASFQPTILVDAGTAIDAGETKPLDDILAASAAERYAEVVEKCLAAPSIAEHGAACTLAACHQHKLVEAKRWFQRVSNARRALVISTCRGLGIQFER